LFEWEDEVVVTVIEAGIDCSVVTAALQAALAVIRSSIITRHLFMRWFVDNVVVGYCSTDRCSSLPTSRGRRGEMRRCVVTYKVSRYVSRE
jgi:hypothetical protein